MPSCNDDSKGHTVRSLVVMRLHATSSRLEPQARCQQGEEEKTEGRLMHVEDNGSFRTEPGKLERLR